MPRMLHSLQAHPMPMAEVVAQADIAELMPRRISALSGGQSQRVRFAIAPLGDPQVSLLDEPTVGMDIGARRAFWRQMRQVAASGRTVVFATHHLEEAEREAGRVVVMDRGRVVADGTGAEIAAVVAGRVITRAGSPRSRSRRGARRGQRRGRRDRRPTGAGRVHGLRRRARRAVHRAARQRGPRRARRGAGPRGGVPADHRARGRGRAMSAADPAARPAHDRSPAMTAPTDSTVLRSAPEPRTAAAPSAATRTLRYAAHTTAMTVTNVAFMVFTIAPPVGMYLLFSMMFGAEAEGQARGMIMINMAAYGGLGAAVTAGTQIQEDQRNGFLRQLVVAGLSPRSFLIGSVIAASAVIVPALAAVGFVGLATGVEASPGRFLLTLVVLWLGPRPRSSSGSCSAWCSGAPPRWPAAW
ncbi:ATP-binding cassette domain-containing protein [Brachybacterium sp. GPGPB12]|uniref:ATP-binding cassette domain-containing protein n=1 Tax=Brachybacterium sp. GPGPB12 TaxID=3023517 RepID=UPI00313447DC